MSFNAARAVLIAADSWDSLRRSDVYRVFDTYDSEHWSAIFEVLKSERTDLVSEALEVLAELEAENTLIGGAK